ncbi:MAG TPA: MarR family winged helix-turn-helix transcriptional regulator [Caulobacter sp.]|nr:MarR family winged helix-turn-helix transcriptional regulator [Caulobacter sp.]
MTAPANPRLMFLLSAASRRVQRWIEAETAGKGGVTAAQAGVLFYLGRDDGALIGEVAEALDAAPSAMTGLIDRMERAGLVERRADPTDGRAQRIYMTDAGRAAREAAKAGLSTVNARLTEGFSEAEVETIARWLSSLQTRFPQGAPR